MTGPRLLFDEGCDDAYGITDERQARGIVAIHGDCSPPCVRLQVAEGFLADLRSSTES